MNENASLKRAASAWWMLLVAGTFWILFGFVLLSFSYTTVWAIAVFAGIGFLVGGLLDLTLGFMSKSYRWTHIIFGLIGIGAGAFAVAWPSETYLIFARILAWFLFVSGVAAIMMSIATHGENEMWWLQLIVGVGSLAVGVWAIRDINGSLTLLALWAGIAALCRGMSDLFVGFGLHGVKKEIQRGMGAAQLV